MNASTVLFSKESWETISVSLVAKCFTADIQLFLDAVWCWKGSVKGDFTALLLKASFGCTKTIIKLQKSFDFSYIQNLILRSFWFVWNTQWDMEIKKKSLIVNWKIVQTNFCQRWLWFHFLTKTKYQYIVLNNFRKTSFFWLINRINRMSWLDSNIL